MNDTVKRKSIYKIQKCIQCIKRLYRRRVRQVMFEKLKFIR